MSAEPVTPDGCGEHRPPFLFVVGCGRSGTTLLRAMLDSHPDLSIPAESHFVVELALRRDRYERAPGFDAEAFVRELVASGTFPVWGLRSEEVLRAVADARPGSFPEAVRVVFRARAARDGKRRFGDKTPSYVLHLPLLAALFPEARFVHLIRDGRDVALSMRDVEWAPRGLEPAALLWRASVEAGRRAGFALGPGRYREVRYERLVAAPEATLAGVCELAELPFDRRMLDHRGRVPSILGELRLPAEQRNLARPPTAGLRDWRRDMSAAEVRMFEAVAGDLLEELGYPLAGRPSGSGAVTPRGRA